MLKKSSIIFLSKIKNRNHNVNPCVFSNFHTYGTIKKMSGSSAIRSEKDASELFSYIKNDLRKDDIIIDATPGPGHFSKQVLLSTNSPLVTCDGALKELKNHYPNRIFTSFDLTPVNLYYEHQTTTPSDKVYLHHVIKKLYKPNSSIKVFTTIKSRQFLYVLLNGLTQVFTNHPPRDVVWYLCATDSIFNLLTRDTRNLADKRLSLLYQFLFDITPIQKFVMKTFGEINLIRISTKQNLFETISPREFKNLIYFFNYILPSHNDLTLIDVLEEQIIEAGKMLIMHGFKNNCLIRDLTVVDCIKAYKAITTMPHYKESFYNSKMKEDMLTYFTLVDDFAEYYSYFESVQFNKLKETFQSSNVVKRPNFLLDNSEILELANINDDHVVDSPKNNSDEFLPLDSDEELYPNSVSSYY